MKNDELLTRAVSEVVPKKLAETKLQSGKPLRLYFGIDPTGTKLHLGHSVPLRKMRAFQDAGHEVILLIGSFTAMVGDPSGRDQMRQPLTKEEVKKNFETYLDQAKKILDTKKLIVQYNHEWLEKMSLKDVTELSSHFTVQQMLQRDMFKERMKKDAPISVTEFLYPLMVGYDSVMLDVDVELGGNDQLFNMLAGRTLQTAMGKRNKFVMTVKLLDGTDGRKMSKTYENCIYLTDEPADMYGKVMTILDDLIPLYMEYCTGIPMSEIESVKKALKAKKENPKVFKMRLAKEIVTLYHGTEKAAEAEAAFDAVFAKKGVPDDMPEYKAKKGELLIDALLAAGMVSSKSDARRLIEQGGIKVDDQVVDSIDTKAHPGIVKVGKRKFVKIV